MNKENKIVSDEDLDILFREARTYNGWLDKPVSDVLIKALYDLLKWGPTSANCCPARFVFVKSQEAKERLKPLLSPGNVEKTMAAPAIAIIGYDLEFYEHLPQLFPAADAKSWFVGKPAFIEETAIRNGSLQAAYLIMAARSLGLDCGPMTGFKKKGVTAEFFPDSNIVANIICNIGYGDPSSLYPRGPRLSFDEAAEII